MKVIILGGFLGSGKTSLVLEMAKYLVGDNAETATKVVILENEIGQVSIDDKVLKGGGLEVNTIFSGCVCCSMSGEVIGNLQTLEQEINPEIVVLEATGVAYPLSIQQTINMYLPEIETAIMCVIDGKRWKRFRKAMENLVTDQIKDAKILFLNKIDTVEPEVVDEVEADVREINQTAKLFRVSAMQGIDETVWKEAFADWEVK